MGCRKGKKEGRKEASISGTGESSVLFTGYFKKYWFSNEQVGLLP